MSRYTSPRLRYLKARLSVLTRPSFLIAAVFLTTVGFVIKEYWTNPDFLKFTDNQLPSTSSNQSPLSEEDKAIAADIDNLSIINYDQQQAQIPITTNIKERDKLKKQNQEQLTKILDLAQKSETANEIKSNTQSATTNTLSPSAQNPFLAQAENLLKFNGSNEQPAIANNISPFSSLQVPQTSSNGINNNSNQNVASESALKTAIDRPNNQSQGNSTAATSTNNLTLPTSPINQGLRQNPSNPLVDTTVFNQPLNTQPQNPYSNFNNNQIQYPDNNYNQPYDFNNNQYLNNYNQQNSYSNYNNQLPTNNYNQPNLNNQVQPYSNNNTLITGNRYSPEIQTRINNIYNRLNNRNNPTVTPNTYSSPINAGTNFPQPNVQQFNSPYSQQTPVQYPNNGYGY
ncbi:hypothetical protein [Rivularia sp. UHCC 0363]|uniref:hypothetical protein n=1 Tax=Rivularia sp. UHCC 0363 TaxID=3110244 RepID=UPI002B1FDF92|nr:hypothetical protein [Rivularia sp. UHCC 0363]MEA5596502.1 hypothetical protein [Rivularia sp. UHCC 0363]